MAQISNVLRKRLFIAFLLKNERVPCRFVSTTGKKQDGSPAAGAQESAYRKVPDFSKPLDNKNWVSYGYDYENEKEDRFRMHFTSFLLYTVLICGVGFLHIYAPDKNRRGWCQREAFIRLHEREQLGLDPIDKNYVDPSKIVLPPDEELSDDDIVI